MNKIIFVSDLTLWSMGKGNGGPAFTKTIQKYIDDSFEVFLISNVFDNKDNDYLDSDHNILIKPTWFGKLVSIRKIGIFFKMIDHFIITARYKKAISKVVKKNEDAVLYAYEIYGVKACAEMSKKLNVPFVTRFQGTILSAYDNTFINRLRCYPHFNALKQKADLVIMTNDGTQGNRVLNKLKNDSRTLFVLNGLDLLDLDLKKMADSFNRSAFRVQLSKKLDDNACMFLTVSRLVSWKRLDRVIDGFAQYCNNNEKGILVIVGDGNEKKSLEKRVSDYKIDDRVIFLGAVKHDMVYKYMMACDIFLSLYDLSNVGNPLLEAMTLGKCIITYDAGDTNKFIKNKTNGILLKNNQLKNLGSVMEKLAKDKNIRDEYGESAREFAKKNFWTWEKRMEHEKIIVEKLHENYI